MIDVTSQIDVDRPADAVFSYLADFENNPRWQGGMRSCRWITPPPIQVGSRYEQEAAFLGRPIRSTFEVTALEPGSTITIDTIESTFPITVTRSVHPLGPGRSRVRAHVRGDPSGVFRIASPLLRLMVQRSVRGDYRRLKQQLEGGQTIRRGR